MSTGAPGTRIAYNTANTAFTPIAAGASLPGGWTQVLNLKDVDPKLNDTEEYDDSSLEDTGPIPAQVVKPGSWSFAKKRNAQTNTLLGFCDGSTKKAWIIVYADGATLYIASGVLSSTSAGKATAGDFKSKVEEAYKITGMAVTVPADHG